MTDPQPHTNKPTSKQLRFLRDLALRCGESFSYPGTVAEASAEIERLKGRKRSGVDERRREARQVTRELAELRGDAASITPAEISGYGGNCRWLHRRAAR